MVNTEIRLIIFFAAEDGEALYSQQKQEQRLIVAQIKNSLLKIFRLKLKNVGETTKPFRYDLNQIPYGYTVEVTTLDLIVTIRLDQISDNLLDLIDRVPENNGQIFITLYRRW